MDNKDVESGLNNAVDFISTLWSGVEKAIDVIPPVVLGFIVLIMIGAWIWHKITH